ncbi:MAG: hypothetical protein IJU61_14060 [Victivallales bacterium]|nr:hypothetical protein [Victivallales bacterium]
MNTSTNIEHFTAEGDPAVEQAIADMLRRLADDIHRLADSDHVALYLGGGYGRGEGGVLVTQDGCHLPYNDLDFFAFSKGLSAAKRKVFDDQLASIAPAYEKTIDVSVDFAPVKSIAKLRCERHTLMYQELLYSHRLVCGPDLLAEVACPDAHELPVLEALRLLVNRGMGLLFATQRLATAHLNEEGHIVDDNVIDFAVRNLHKVALGAGDALLIAQQRYDYNLERRLKIIMYDAHTNSIFKEIAPFYKAARDFKFLPGSQQMNPLDKLPDYLKLWLNATRNFVALTTDRSAAVLETTRQMTDCLYGHPAFIGRSPMVNALRWFTKTKTARPLRLLFKNATVRLFTSLHETLHDIQWNLDNGQPLSQAFGKMDNSRQELVRLWEIFN